MPARRHSATRMTPEAGPATSDRRAARSTSATAWLGMAATPVFAAMALLSATHDDGPAAMLCAAAGADWALDGMVPMYALMSLFHCAPWVKLIARRHAP
jgi:hypothetical protein